MSQQGVGAMLHYLSGGSEQSSEKYHGRKIVNAELIKEGYEHKWEGPIDTFRLTFDDGVVIDITDNGQSCCESRYMTCDDDLKSLIGQTLKHIIVKDSLTRGEYDVHETCFLEVQGDKSSVTFATHNEHNGYYGGFGLNISEKEKT